MPELLLPAGNFEKMKAALLYGADAVYLSGKRFGMRSAADNFTVSELSEAADYAHKRGKKIYLTVNTTPHTNEYPELERYLSSLDGIGIDALIIADVGVSALAKRLLPDVSLHISTQAGAVSHADCAFWHSVGASRVVLARELSLDEILEIRAKTPSTLELEAFIHGSMCVSWSGRCLLSQHFVGRDANRGACTQPCRWDYKLFEIEEKKHPERRFPIVEEDGETFIMSSRDMCMIEHIPELMKSGISSFKIEGRMKSAYYAAVCANTYRMAIDEYTKDPDGYRYNPAWLAELESVNRREYCTGYWFDDPRENAMTVTRGGYLAETAYLSQVISYDGEAGRTTLVQKNKMSEGEEAELLTPGKTGRRFTVSEMRDADGQPISSSPHPAMVFSIDAPFEMRPGDIIRGTRKNV